MSQSAANDSPQHVASILVARKHTVSNQEGGRAHVVRNHPHRGVRYSGSFVADFRKCRDMPQQLPE